MMRTEKEIGLSDIGSAIEKMVAEGARRRQAAIEESRGYLSPDDIRDGRPGRFCATSLVCWLAVADQAMIPSIPARQIGSLRHEVLCRVLDGETLSADEAAGLDAISTGLRPGEVLRVDCCAGSAVKHHMAIGGYPAMPKPDSCRLDDPRLFEILGRDPREEVPVLARPWQTDFATVSGAEGGTYPVEWRVFFGGHADDLAVSAYYPQAPLGEEWLRPAQQARILALRMKRVMRDQGIQPWLPRYAEAPSGLHCTMDFVTLNDRELRFLEAGPPHLSGWGAHPCCFEGRRPEGVALRVEEAADE